MEDHLVERGVFARTGVISPDEAERFRRHMSEAHGGGARVSRGGAFVLDPAYRRTRSVVVVDEVAARVVEVFDGLRGDIERYFDEALGPCQPPVFLVYEPGDYFRPHSDNIDDPRQPPHIRARRATVVLFLNGPRRVGHAAGKADDPTADPGADDTAAGEDGFSGGELILYRTVPEPTWSDFYTTVPAEPGMLVAFRAEVTHEVAPVTAGRRYSIVSWFQAAKGASSRS